jgi:hypothetical protein
MHKYSKLQLDYYRKVSVKNNDSKISGIYASLPSVLMVHTPFQQYVQNQNLFLATINNYIYFGY